jgi:hypothetical protein
MERNVGGASGQDLTLRAGGAKAAQTNKIGGDLYLQSGISTGNNTSNIFLQTATAGSSGTADNTPTTKMTILGNGNVGINTITPGSSLDVKGTLRLSGSTSGYVGLQPAAAAGSTTYALPSSDGTSGQQLTTNGAGLLTWTNQTGPTTAANTSSANSLSTTVNGTTGATVNIINTNALNSSSNTLTSTVNGLTSTGVPIINSNATSISGSSLTTTVNGVAATALDLTPAIVSKAWSLTGNSGTSGANFIGTADNNSLRIKTNNISRMILDSLGNAGIGTSTPTNTLHVYASSNPIRIEGIQKSSSVNDKVLVTDATGVLKTAISSSSSIAGYLNANFTTSGTSINKIIVQTVLYDASNEYNSSTGFFVPTVTGTYQFEVEITISNSSANGSDYGTSTDKSLIGMVNNTTGAFIDYHNFENAIDPRSYFFKGIISLTAGTSYYFGIQTPTGTNLIYYFPTGGTGSGIGTYFSIQRIN